MNLLAPKNVSREIWRAKLGPALFGDIVEGWLQSAMLLQMHGKAKCAA